MTTLIINIQNGKDLSFLQEMLDRVGLDYEVENDEEYSFSKEEMESFAKRKQDFIDGKTTARSLDDIEKGMNLAYN